MSLLRIMKTLRLGLLLLATAQSAAALTHQIPRAETAAAGRERIDFNFDWRFSRFTSNPDSLSYTSNLKSWVLPSANDFIVTGSKHQRPTGAQPGANVQYVQSSFDDSAWEAVNLPHDWAIKGPFNAPGISGGMGRLPTNGVGWYRKKFSVEAGDLDRSVFLDVDGAMSYATVWLNGNLVGGWPHGYASWRLDLTPYLKAGNDNTLAIRLDNAVDSSRWYPGAGIYRNVWLVKTDKTHVGQFGTYITTSGVSAQSATVNLAVDIENKINASRSVDVATEIRVYDATSRKPGAEVVATIPSKQIVVAAGTKQSVNGSTAVSSPLLWGPPPAQKPNLYVAVTTVTAENAVIDTYETVFGIRTLAFDANKGVFVNGQPVRIKGTCNHHDLGSLGAAFNTRAAERQLQMLQEMGGNALRTSHNPPAAEYLELADRLGFLVLDEIFDCWATQKTTNDYHLLWTDWHEPDLRSFIRRDRNHPSVIAWSFGNELPEQSSTAGANIARELKSITNAEDPTRLVHVAMNNAGPTSGLAGVLDIEGLNYQGEGHGTSNSSTFPGFHSAFPDKLIWSSESASAVSTRGTYLFPVTSAYSAVVGDSSGAGGDAAARHVSAYELYGASWGASPDKVFFQQDKYPYVAGEFVWTGWDYLGEPTPYDSSRSSYFGIIDLAGFKKDRFFLYQARWNPDLPMAHILPHWTWPDRVGQTTPVHVFSGADEAELFVNGKSAGRKTRPASAWRFRWDDVKYQPGDLRVVAYKDGKEWATNSQKTAGAAAQLNGAVDRSSLSADGYDVSFVSVAVVDGDGTLVPDATNNITFSIIEGPGRIVSTDNGDPTDIVVFPSLTRKAFGGRALAIVKADKGATGRIVIQASATGLTGAQVTIQAN